MSGKSCLRDDGFNYNPRTIYFTTCELLNNSYPFTGNSNLPLGKNCMELLQSKSVYSFLDSHFVASLNMVESCLAVH